MPWRGFSYFTWTIKDFPSVFLLSTIWICCARSFEYVYLFYCSLSFLHLWIRICCYFWTICTYHVFKYFFCPVLSLVSFSNLIIVCEDIWHFLTALGYFVLFGAVFFNLCILVWAISFDLSSRSQILWLCWFYKWPHWGHLSALYYVLLLAFPLDSFLLPIWSCVVFTISVRTFTIWIIVFKILFQIILISVHHLSLVVD